MKSKPFFQWTVLLLFAVFTISMLNADVALAPENPFPANGATGVQLQDLKLSWSQTQDASNQPYQYQGFYIYASPKTIPGYTYKFTNTGIHYYLSNNADTWTNAKTICNTNKWRIGCPWHEDIQNSMQANNEGVTTWIGFSDAATEGAFRWENGRSFSYTNWNTGEPNDAGGVEDYAEMFSNGMWNDAGSGSSRRYWIEVDSWISHTKVIGTNYYDLNCKLEPYTTYNWAVYTKNLSGYGPTSYWSFTTGGDGTAPSSYPAWGSPNNEAGPAEPLNPTLTWAAVPGATYYKLYVFKSRSRLGTTVTFINGHVYQKTSTTLNYNDTRAAVEADGGHLVAINSQDEQDILPNDNNYWIGFHDPGGDGYSGEGWYTWDVGEPSAFYNWDLNNLPPEPNGQTSENYVIQGTAAGKLWYDVSGTSSFRSLYEYPADVLDGVVVNGTSYSFGETNLPANTLYRWIAVPYNEYGRPFFQSGQCSFYTTNSPGTAPGTISAITPSNGAVGVAINAELNWTPPTGSPTEYYAYLGTNNSIGNSANYTNLGIFNGHCYYQSNHGYDWHWAAANVQAQKDGGYLATMGTANENAISAGAENMWFGGLDLKATNIFKYANDDPWTYTSWYPEEPNNASGTQYFTVQNWQNPGMWDDQGTDPLLKYVVEVAPNITDGERVTSANYAPPLLMFNTTYYWSAVGGNNAGMANDTQRWTFTTMDGKAVNPNPSSGAINVTSQAFDWDDVPGATGYLFYLGTADGTWDLENGTGCPTSGFTFGGSFSFSTPYYWKVATVTPLETVQGNTWYFTTGSIPVFEVLVTSQPSGADISVGSKPPAPITPYTFYLNQGSSATYTVSKTDYTWTLDPVYNSNVVTNIAENKHINFIGTYHHVDSGTGFEYTGSPGVSVSYTATTSGSMGAPLPPNTEGLDTATILIFSGSEPSNLTITVSIGTWYVIAYYNGIWNNGVPYPITGPGTVTFANVPLGSKADVPVIISQLDQTLPVELSSFTAVITSDLCVKIAWVAQSETNHSGYNILRGENDILNSALRLNPTLIDNGIPLGTQMSYSYTDQEAYSNMIYYYWLESIALDGSSEFYGPLTVIIGDPGLDPLPPAIPMATRLMNAFPNPFNPNTNLRYSLKEGGKVQINIYNVKGQLIKSFFAEHASPGYYQLAWDGRDQNGKPVTSGIYMYQMSCGRYHETKKMILAK